MLKGNWTGILQNHSEPISLSENKKLLNQLTNTFKKLKYVEFRNKANIIKKIKKVCDDNDLERHPTLWLLAQWCIKLLKLGGTSKRSLRATTVADYVKSVGVVFIRVFYELNLSKLTASDWISNLERVIAEMPSAQRRSYVYYFALFIENSSIVKGFSASDLEVTRVSSRVDANILSLFDAERILRQLNIRFKDSKLARHAYLLFCFCFYSGLRRNEAAKLRTSDVMFSSSEPEPGEFDTVDVYISNHKNRLLKNSSSKRIIPLDALWPKAAIAQLRQFRDQWEYENTETEFFFDQEVTSKAFDLITDVMKQITMDPSMRVHHLRHSFANWMWLKLFFHRNQVPNQWRVQDIYSDEYMDRFYDRTCIRKKSRKVFFQVTLLLGHKSEEVTKRSYLHLAELQHFYEMNNHFPISSNWITGCFGRASLLPFEQGVNIEHRISCYKMKDELIKTTAIQQTVNVHESRKIELTPHLENVEKENINDIRLEDMPLLKWAKIIKKLSTNDVAIVSKNTNIPEVVLSKIIENGADIAENYPNNGKKLNPLPKLPRLHIPKEGSRKSDVYRIIIYLCRKIDNALKSGKLTPTEIRDACQILKHTVTSKDNEIRTPDKIQAIQFIRVCIKLGLVQRHFRFKLYLKNVDDEQRLRIKLVWQEALLSCGLTNEIKLATNKEGKYLGGDNGYGRLAIDLITSKDKTKKVRRSYAFFSLFHLLLTLTYNAE